MSGDGTLIFLSIHFCVFEFKVGTIRQAFLCLRIPKHRCTEYERRNSSEVETFVVMDSFTGLIWWAAIVLTSPG